MLHSPPVRVMAEKARTLEEGDLGAKDVRDIVPERTILGLSLKPQFYKDHVITHLPTYMENVNTLTLFPQVSCC